MICFVRVQLVTLILVTLKISGGEVTDGLDCHCITGCTASPTPCVSSCRPGWDGAFCQRRNLALGQATEQTGSFNDTPACPPPDPDFGPVVCGAKGSDLAVDGKTDHTYWHGSCTHTVSDTDTARWSVNLGGLHLVSHVVIYTDEDLPSSFKHFQLYVDGQWCQNWTASDDDYLVADITCSRPLRGSNLTILNSPDQGNQHRPVLQLCEVQVYECSDFWFGTKCEKQCHCRNVSEVCEKMDGHCASGCALGRSGPDCQMINLAFNKSTYQSSTNHACNSPLTGTTPHGQCSPTSSGLAVDGDPLHGSCSYTNSETSAAYWSVDLGQTRDIHSIRIFNNKNHLSSTRGFLVTVDGVLCYQSDNSSTPRSVMDISCIEDLSGSNVSIILPSWLPGQHMLTLCEVEVYECDNFRYGHSCDNFCNCRDVREACNKTTGQCRSGCASGWTGLNCTQGSRYDRVSGCTSGRYGPDCVSTCGHCANEAFCESATGQCPDRLCSLWWAGPRCDVCVNGTYLHGNHCKPCSGCMNNDCNNVTGRCRQGCKSGFTGYLCSQECSPTSYTYGVDCALHCGVCRNGRPCEPRTGHCVDGCARNFTGETCSECVDGLYGKSCNLTCGECAGGGQCDKIAGNCTHGCLHNRREPLCDACIPQRYGPQCDQVCGHCLYAENCDRVTGNCTRGCGKGWAGSMCLKCDVGYYGPNCTTCGQCADNTTCDVTSGMCPGRCKSGWTTSYCNTECSFGFYGDNCTSVCGQCADNITCDSETGQCPDLKCGEGYMGPLCMTICQHGFYGRSCEFPCGHCLNNGTCDRFTGHCPDGQCDPGYQEPLCHKECDLGNYGTSCSEVCDHCLYLRCDIVTGTCFQNACAEGWEGNMCMQAVGHTKSGVIAAAVIVPVLVIAFVVGIVVWKWRRWRHEKSDHEMTDIPRERHPRRQPR